MNIGNNDGSKFLLMVTHTGTIKKTKINEFDSIRQSGKLAIKLDSGDSLKWLKPTSGEDQVLIVSHDGKSIRFREDDVRHTARDTMGVRGIELKDNYYVVGMSVFWSKKEAPKYGPRKVFEEL